MSENREFAGDENSKAAFERAKRSIPGGVNSPVRAFRSVGLTPLVIAARRGQPDHGHRRQHATSTMSLSWGPLILGHAHPEVVAAIKRTAAEGTSFGAPTELETRWPSSSRAGAVGRDRADGQLRHGGDDERAAAGARLHGAEQDRQVRRLLPRPRRQPAHQGRLRRGDARPAGQPGRAGQRRARIRSRCPTTIWPRSSSRSSGTARRSPRVIVEPVAGNMGVVPPLPGFLKGCAR